MPQIPGHADCACVGVFLGIFLEFLGFYATFAAYFDVNHPFVSVWKRFLLYFFLDTNKRNEKRK
jgi:hypothetical protein